MNRFERLRGASPLVVYIDFKSPYAFIAIEPTRAVARAAGIGIEWRPFTLDIPSFLGSARLDGAGKVVESRRTPAQWSGVKYAYRDARRYARLGGRVVRGTVKIWDSSLAGIGLLWAQRQSAEIADRYLDVSYPPFWERALDIEDASAICDRLAAAGGETTGFADFAAGAGRELHDHINRDAFAAGVFGVPSYLVADEFWFGREHLPRVAWLLAGRRGTCPDPAFALPGDPRVIDAGIAPVIPEADGRLRMRVAVDLRDPRVWLAWEPTEAMACELGVELDWVPFQVAPPAPPPLQLPIEDRGTAHRRLRALHRERETEYCAAARGLELHDPYRQVDAAAAHLGLLWARRQGFMHARNYLASALPTYWSGAFDPGDPVAVGVLLADAGIAVGGFADWASESGPRELADLHGELEATGVSQVPTYLVGSEPFHGSAHLPLLRALYDRSRPISS